jgi:hypothetical protein
MARASLSWWNSEAMGNCIICGKPAGIFRSRHQECFDRNAAFAKKSLGYNDLMRAEIAAAGIKSKRLTYRRPHKQSQIEAH